MSRDTDSLTTATTGPASAQEKKAARLAAALRDNLMRRKGQARARRQGAEDTRPDGMPGESDAPSGD